MEEDQELERKAIEELLKEAKRGKTRAETMGPMGWMKCPLAGTNKRFLINTIKNTLPSHKEQDPEQKEGSKEATKSQGQKEEKRKKHRGHPYKHSFQARAPEGHSPHRKPSGRDKSGSAPTGDEDDGQEPPALIRLGQGVCPRGFEDRPAAREQTPRSDFYSQSLVAMTRK